MIREKYHSQQIVGRGFNGIKPEGKREYRLKFEERSRREMSEGGEFGAKGPFMTIRKNVTIYLGEGKGRLKRIKVLLGRGKSSRQRSSHLEGGD